MRALLARLRDLARRRTLLDGLEEELRFHHDQLVREYQRRGYTPEAARAAARRDLGNTVRAREDLRAQAGWPAVEDGWSDLRLAGRALRRRPGLTLGVAGVLALGLGAALSLLVLVDAVFLRPLPVAAPRELAVLREGNGDLGIFTAGTFRRLEAAAPPGVRLAVHSAPGRVTVQRGEAPAERVEAQLVGGDFFGALGVGTLAGRLLTTADDRLDDPAAVAVVEAAWARERFGTPSAAVGAEIRVNRYPVTIVGVLAPDFRGVVVGGRTHVWLPLSLQRRLNWWGNAWALTAEDRPNDPDWNREERVAWLHALVRQSAPDPAPFLPVLTAAARPALEEWARLMDDPREAESFRRRSWTLEPAATGYSSFRGSFGGTSRLLAGIIAALLLLTIANISNLLLVRTLSRHREFGVRLALGSGRWRVNRLGLFEALLLSGLGAAGGVLLAVWLVPAAAALLAPGQELALDVVAWRPLLALLGLSGLVGLLCAWAPAAWIARLDPLVALAGRASALRSPQRLGRMLVVLQVAVAVVLVMVAVALARELQRTLTADPGFAKAQVLTATVDPASAGYESEDVVQLQARVEAAVRSLPGVEAVGWARNGILSGSRNRSVIYPRGDGRPGPVPYQSDQVVPSYFETVGFRLVRGRLLHESDRTGPPVAVVSQGFAREVFPQGDALGRSFGYGAMAGADDFTIVGIVSDAQINAVSEAPPPLFFVPWTPEGGALRYLAVRTAGPAGPLARELRETLVRLDPNLVWSPWRTLEERVELDLGSRLSASRLVLVLAATALLLATIGMGVSLAHLVTLRRREIAVRLALGAGHGRIVADLVRDAGRLAFIGGVGGIGICALLQALPAARPFVRDVWDPWVLVAALGGSAVAALLGAWRPARGAVKVDPQRLLAAE